MPNPEHDIKQRNTAYMKALLRGEATLNPARLLLVATEAIARKITQMTGTIFRRNRHT